MRVNYIQCMDFTFENAYLPDYSDIYAFNKAMEDGKMIKVVSSDGSTTWVNSMYIMFVGV